MADEDVCHTHIFTGMTREGGNDKRRKMTMVKINNRRMIRKW